MGAERPWDPALSSSKAPLLLLWVRVGLGKTTSLSLNSGSVQVGRMCTQHLTFHGIFDNAQSGDKKAAQIFGDCAMVYVAKTHGTEIVSM